MGMIVGFELPEVGGPYNYGPSRHCRVTPETDTEHIFQEVCSIVFST